ncbi:hypothetical protein N2152v2_011170 [Parachlorella kessleri]
MVLLVSEEGPQEPMFVPAKVFIGGVAPDSTNETLLAYCGQWGEVADCHVMTGKGYAFVTFQEVPSAQAFLEHREHFIDGRKVDVKAAVPKDQGGSKLTKKMFVGGTGEITDDDFRAYFAQFGNITDCVVLRKHDGGSRGFGFVTYDDEVSVEKCLVMPHVLNGKAVEVKRAVGKDQSPGGGMGLGMARGGMMGGMGGGMMGGGMGGGGGMDRTGKQPDWVCNDCGNKNFGWRQFCNRCKVPKPAGALGGSMGGMGMGAGMGGMGGMGAMAGMGYDTSGYGAAGYGATGYGMGSMAGMGMTGMGMGGIGMGGGMTGMGMGGMMGTGMMGTSMGGMGTLDATAGMGADAMGAAGYGRVNGARSGGASSGGQQQQRFRPY